MARRPVPHPSGWAFFVIALTGALFVATQSASAASTQLYIATLQPIAGVNSLGYGSATLLVSADQTYATLRFSFSSLSSPVANRHLRGPGGASLFDVDMPQAPSPPNQPLPDGSYQWIFDTSPNAQYTVAQVLNLIATGQTYLVISTNNYPDGEIKGFFVPANGSQTFTPPNPPPQITINPPTAADASRFLSQAGFGGTIEEINALSNASASNASTALNDWLTAQYATPLPISPTYAATTQPASTTFSPTSMYQTIYNRVTIAQAPNAYADTLNTARVPEAWWGNVLSGQDQLRQRIATAYSEIFVVSEENGTIANNVPGLASYYDMLADDAFVNFRQLIGDVTLHPIMGEYLNMRGNVYSKTSSPNENYAREIMQLFTIGLYELFPDGTLQLDSTGNPIATYSQTQITSMANVYTGWNTSTAYVIPTLPQPTSGNPVVVNFKSTYQQPMVVTAANHSPIAKTLLSYTGAKLWTGGATTQPTDPVTIPANAKPTAASATTELNFLLDNIFNHPNVGPFICKQLIQRVVTSNPSNGYVYRAAKVFANDGTGVRGNMKAVITAILTDYEARSPAIYSGPTASQTAGRMREPTIRMADILRPLNAFSKTGKWKIGNTDDTLTQTIFRSPTVFNFFPPDFAQPGPIQDAGDVAPEFAIIYATTIAQAQNMIYTGLYSPNYNASPTTGTGWKGDNFGSNVYIPLPNPTASTPAGLNLFGTTVPSLTNVNDPTIASKGGCTLGLKFTSDVAGSITGVRFYKGTQNTGTHTGALWSSSGTQLATATFTGESASGWQTVKFGTAVKIAASTTYIVSYHTTAAYIAYAPQGMVNSVDVAPLHGLASGASGGNGVYAYDATPGTSAFPANTNGQSPNYWVDVTFNPSASVTNSTVFASTSAPDPSLQNLNDPGIPAAGVELGMKFRSDVYGTITAVRFYKGTQNTGTHTGSLWSSNGTLLATATFTGETGSGWQQANFSTPVAITPGATYTVSYHTKAKYIAYTPSQFASAVDSAPLHAWAANSAFGNGVYLYGASAFPTVYNGQAPNYWVDVVFAATSAASDLTSIAKNQGAAAMLTQLGTVLNNGPLDPNVQTLVQSYITNTANVSSTDYQTQVKAAVYLIATSAQAAAEK